MLFVRAIKCTAASFILAFSLTSFAVAKTVDEPAAVIMFKSSRVTNEIVFSATKTMTRMHKSISKSFDLVVRKISVGDNPGEDDEYLNSKFQGIKQGLAYSLQKPKIQMQPFFEYEITMDIKDDGNGNHLQFYLPLIDFRELGETSIYTVDDANITINRLTALIQKINEVLPSDYARLSGFINPQEIPLQSTKEFNQLTLTHAEDSKALLQSLIFLNHIIRRDLNQVLNLAKLAANGKHTEAELHDLNNQYLDMCNTVYSDLRSEGSNPFQNINLFHDIVLNFELDGKTYEYFFPKINLAGLNLKEDNILNLDAAVLSLKHLSVANFWLMNWLITGTTRLSDINQNNLQNILSNMPIEPKVRELMEEQLSNRGIEKA